MTLFEKRELARHEWVLTIFGQTIPVAAIGQFAMVLFLFVLVGLAYNIGQNDATEQMKMAAFICSRNADPLGGYHCDVRQLGSRIVWVCNDTSSAGGLPSAPIFANWNAT